MRLHVLISMIIGKRYHYTSSYYRLHDLSPLSAVYRCSDMPTSLVHNTMSLLFSSAVYGCIRWTCFLADCLLIQTARGSLAEVLLRLTWSPSGNCGFATATCSSTTDVTEIALALSSDQNAQLVEFSSVQLGALITHFCAHIRHRVDNKWLLPDQLPLLTGVWKSPAKRRFRNNDELSSWSCV